MAPIPDPPRESTPLLPSSALINTSAPSFRRLRSSVRPSVTVDECAQPIEGLVPLFPGGIRAYDDRKFVPYRKASLVKSMPAVTPYRRKARHRDYRLYWINQFRHWWKSSRLLVRLAGLYVFSHDSHWAPKVLLLDPERHNSIRKLVKFSKRLGQGGPMREFLKTVKPFTRSMRIFVGGWRWIEAAPCRRGEVGLEEFMAFVGNRVSRIVARTFTDSTAGEVIFPFQRFLFRQDILMYPMNYHPVTICVLIGIFRAIAPFASSFQGSRFGRVLSRHFSSSSKNRWLPVQRIEELNLKSDDAQESDEVSQSADLVIVARLVAKALGVVEVHQTEEDGKARHLALMDAGFEQVGAGSGGYSVYQYQYQGVIGIGPTPILLHITPYGPSICDVMPYYAVLEYETSFDRRDKWSEFVSKSIMQGPPVVEGFCYQGAFFSPHHFAELKDMYDKQLLRYEIGCKKLPKISMNTRHGGPPRDLPTLKALLNKGKKMKKQKQNQSEFNQMQKVVSSVCQEIIRDMKREKREGKAIGTLAPKGVILYFEGLDCSGKSSTGGLVQAALENAGYTVGMRQYNRPPTAEQRAQPWMDRFEMPTEKVLLDLTDNSTDDKTADEDVRIGLVWDRGPVGDFVYGNLNDLPLETKEKRYEEFREFDRKCREKGILFLKLFFVTNRDSIAKVLGKRLAQKKMALDLKTWLQASDQSIEDSFEGLDAIEAHIDPTDFIAFNNYERNLRIFSNIVLNTDNESNPWVVINTGDRFAARKALMQRFRSHLHQYKTGGKHCSSCCDKDDVDGEAIEIDDMMKTRYRLSWRHSAIAWICFMGLLLLAFIYAENTKWTDSWYRVPVTYNISGLLEADDDEIIALKQKVKKPKAPKTPKTAKTDTRDVVKEDKEDDAADKAGKKGTSDEDFDYGDDNVMDKAGKKM